MEDVIAFVSMAVDTGDVEFDEVLAVLAESNGDFIEVESKGILFCVDVASCVLTSLGWEAALYRSLMAPLTRRLFNCSGEVGLFFLSRKKKIKMCVLCLAFGRMQ